MALTPPAIGQVNSSALQEPVSLSSDGSRLIIGAPGGPVIFADPDEPIVPMLAGSPARSVTHT